VVSAAPAPAALKRKAARKEKEEGREQFGFRQPS